LALSLMPCKRRLVFSLIQQAECPAFFDQSLQARGAEPVRISFGKGLAEQIVKPEARPRDRIGRAAEGCPEASAEKVLHNAS
jgi:hypothetical protein